MIGKYKRILRRHYSPLFKVSSNAYMQWEKLKKVGKWVPHELADRQSNWRSLIASYAFRGRVVGLQMLPSPISVDNHASGALHLHVALNPTGWQLRSIDILAARDSRSIDEEKPLGLDESSAINRVSFSLAKASETPERQLKLTPHRIMKCSNRDKLWMENATDNNYWRKCWNDVCYRTCLIR